MNEPSKPEGDRQKVANESTPTEPGKEIERKYLVEQIPNLSKQNGEAIIQGYLTSASDSIEVRARQKGDQYYLTIKGKGDLARTEVELEISKEQFASLWPATAPKRVEKTRYKIAYADETIELDIYGGALTGLVIAEVEFLSEEHSDRFTPPAWFGREVTAEEGYKNQQLAVKGIPSKS